MNIYNNEHYPDPTAQTAMDNVQRAQEDAERRLTQLIGVIKPIIDWAGFDLCARIELRDRRTGRIFR